MRCHNAGKRGRQFRSQSDFALAFVDEVEKLTDDFVAAFFPIKLGRLKDGAIPFDKTVAAGDLSPLTENVISGGAIVR